MIGNRAPQISHRDRNRTDSVTSGDDLTRTRTEFLNGSPPLVVPLRSDETLEVLGRNAFGIALTEEDTTWA